MDGRSIIIELLRSQFSNLYKGISHFELLLLLESCQKKVGDDNFQIIPCPRSIVFEVQQEEGRTNAQHPAVIYRFRTTTAWTVLACFNIRGVQIKMRAVEANAFGTAD